MIDIINGDCLEIMLGLGAESVDAVVTDPPYGLAFMGKAWDSFKPGDIAMRRNPQMDALNAGMSRQGGRQRACSDYQKRQARDIRNYQEWFTEIAVGMLRVAKPGAHLLAFGGTRTHHRLMCAIEDAGWEIRDCMMWLYGSGFPKSLNIGDGWGTALKPAWEPIVMARKPLIGTVAANVERYGTGGINVDASRIATDESLSQGSDKPGACFSDDAYKWGKRETGQSPLGRFPANLLLDEDAAAMLDEQSGGLRFSSGMQRTTSAGWLGTRRKPSDEPIGFGDSGGASRFFYIAKASRSEREEGVTGEPVRRTDGREKELENPRLRTSSVKNHHPTVKPVSLMRWLVHLVTPSGGVILDPFCGSGTTGIAAAEGGFGFIGIEKETEYYEIARARISEAQRQGILDYQKGPSS